MLFFNILYIELHNYILFFIIISKPLSLCYNIAISLLYKQDNSDFDKFI